jgi:hypothetical protein
MMTCYVLFAEPGNVFQGLHRTVDGAVHRAAALGAVTTEDGDEMSIEAAAEELASTGVVTFLCSPIERCELVRIELHGICV